MEGITIQVCTSDNVLSLVPLIAALAREEHTEPVEAHRLEQVVRRLIDTKASDFLLATLDSQTVGCLQISWRLSTWHGEPYAYLEDVYVVPHMRGRGIGRQMLLAASARAEVYGADQIMLDVRNENHAAQRLYENLGFSNSGSLVMKRALAGLATYEYHDSST